MPKRIRIIASFFLVLILAAAGAGAWWQFRVGSRASSLQRNPGVGALANFELYDSESNAFELYRMADQAALVFGLLSSRCPTWGVQADSEQGIGIYALDSERGDSREVIEKLRGRLALPIPVLRDPSQLVARELGLRRAGEGVVVDARSWRVVHRGSIRSAIQAAREVRAGRVPAPQGDSPDSAGCTISFLEEGVSPEYGKHIAPILKEKCLNCHSKKGQFPPYFDGYLVLQSWKKMIRETVMTGKMPIWGIDSRPGEFVGDASLSPREKALLVRWLDQGLPRQTGSDPLEGYEPPLSDAEPPGSTFQAGQDQDVEVPAEGFGEYHYFQLGEALPRDMWVTSIFGVSTNPRAMHHATLNVVPHPISYYRTMAENISMVIGKENPSVSAQALLGLAMRKSYEQMSKASIVGGAPLKQDEWIRMPVYSAFGRNNSRKVPGKTFRFLPKGYYLILETHHNGTGRPERERTKLFFYETKNRHGLRSLHRLDLYDAKVVIPPGAKNFKVPLPDFEASRDLYILSCNPHMHARGRALHVWVEFPDGRRENVISYPSFLFDWHPGVEPLFSRPKFLPKGARLKSFAVVDNSALNPYNPNPNLAIRFGQRLFEDEMPKVQCLYYFDKD